MKFAVVPLMNAFCATGSGGGVDPHCGKAAKKGMIHKLKRTGGFSYVAGQKKYQNIGQNGYAVSPYPNRSAVFARKVEVKDVRKFMEKNGDLLSKPGHAVGAWRDPSTGKTYLDVSIITRSRNEAIELGRRHNQISIFDFKSGNTVDTGGTGTHNRLGFRGHRRGDSNGVGRPLRIPVIIFNAFCKTGKGGGVDPSCGTGKTPAMLARDLKNTQKVERLASERAQRIAARVDRYRRGPGAVEKIPVVPIIDYKKAADDLMTVKTMRFRSVIDLQHEARRLRDAVGSQTTPQEVADFLGSMRGLKSHELRQVAQAIDFTVPDQATPQDVVKAMSSKLHKKWGGVKTWYRKGLGQLHVVRVLKDGDKRRKSYRQATGRKQLVKSFKPKALMKIKNAFCPTGDGGGQDNSCSSKGESASASGGSVNQTLHKTMSGWEVRAETPHGTVEYGKHKGVTSSSKQGFYVRFVKSGSHTAEEWNFSTKGPGMPAAKEQAMHKRLKKLGVYSPISPSKTQLDDLSNNAADDSVTNAFCPTGKGGGIDPSCGLKGNTLPEIVYRGGKNQESSNPSTGGVYFSTSKSAAGEYGLIGEHRLKSLKVIDLGNYNNEAARFLLKQYAGKPHLSKEEFDETATEVMMSGDVRGVMKKSGLSKDYAGFRLSTDVFLLGKTSDWTVKDEKPLKKKKLKVTPIGNAFCSTGKGGGVDPSCGEGSGKSSSAASIRSTKADTPTKWVKERFSDWAKKLSASEKKALGTYQGSGYHLVNDTLRRGGQVDPKLGVQKFVDKIVKDMDSAIAKGSAPLDMDIYVFRGVKGTIYSKAKSGDMIVQDAYTSTTLDRNVAEKIAKKSGIVVEMLIKKGTSIAAYDALGEKYKESELLLPRGGTIRVVSVKKVGGRRHITAEFVEKKKLKVTPIENAYCPTGDGGGIDPTCGGKGGGSKSKKTKVEKMSAQGKDYELREVPSNRTSAQRANGKPHQQFDVYHQGQKIGYVHTYDADQDTKIPGARYVASRKSVTKWGFSLDQDYHQVTWGYGQPKKSGSHAELGFKSKKVALETMAKFHRSPTNNAFCKTGKGGGIDPTCGSGKAKIPVTPLSKSSTTGSKIASEAKTPPPPGASHQVQVDKVGHDGVTKAARVGVSGHDVPPPPDLKPMPNLTHRERRVEQKFMSAYNANPDGMANDFRRLVKATAKDGDPPTFGTDDAKMLTNAWNHPKLSAKDRANNRATLNIALHQTANAVAKRAFMQELDTLKKGDEILVTVGGCGAGKGFALKNVPQALAMKSKAKAVWDSAGDQNATENPWIQKEAEKRGLKVNYVFVHADPKTQWAHPERGIVKRAADPADGRMVDAKVFADSYAIGAKNHEAFFQANKGNRSASFVFLDNSGPPKMIPGVPKEALRLDRKALARSAADEVKKIDAPAHVKRGALIGKRIWGDD